MSENVPSSICAQRRFRSGCAILDSQWCNISSSGQRTLWSDCAHAQADLILRWWQKVRFLTLRLNVSQTRVYQHKCLREIGTLSWEATLSKLFYSLSKNDPLWWEIMYSRRNKLFPYSVDPFQKKMVWCTEKQLGSHKSCLPWLKKRQIYQIYKYITNPLNQSHSNPVLRLSRVVYNVRAKPMAYAQSCRS